MCPYSVEGPLSRPALFTMSRCYGILTLIDNFNIRNMCGLNMVCRNVILLYWRMHHCIPDMVRTSVI